MTERGTKEKALPFLIHMTPPPPKKKMLSYWLFSEELRPLPQAGSELLHSSWNSLFPSGSSCTSCGSLVPCGLLCESPKENESVYRASEFLTWNSAVLSTIAHFGNIFFKLTRPFIPQDMCVFRLSSFLENWDIHLWAFIHPAPFCHDDPSTLTPNPTCWNPSFF